MDSNAQRDPILQIFKERLRRDWTWKTHDEQEYVLVQELKRWMYAQEQGHNHPNVTRLILAAYDHQIHLHPEVEPDEICNSLAVFGLLLAHDHGDYMSRFFEAGIDDATLPMRLSDTDEINSKDPDLAKVVEKVKPHKWAFCPVYLSPNMRTILNSPKLVLPFCRKEKVNVKGGTADVWQVLVKEEAIHENLREQLHNSFVLDKDYGKCYQLAVKTFAKRNEHIYKEEKSAFGVIKNKNGMVRCFGSYEIKVPRGDESEKDMPYTYNLILEYGTLDLDEYLVDESPPVLAPEIFSFWTTLFRVAEAIRTIHSGEVGGLDAPHPFHGWHADVKPDNILRIDDEFKLADFGFAKFKHHVENVPSEYIDGGTETYGAPECDSSRQKGGTRTAMTQTIDTWSFGCVLSVAATWVVLGIQGPPLYSKFREIAIQKLRARQKSDDGVRTPTSDNTFHDGKDVLPDIREWHNYLRLGIRSSDTLTSRVLSLVDEHLLHGDFNERYTSKDLCAGLREIEQASREEWDRRVGSNSVVQLSSTFLDMLVDIDRITEQSIDDSKASAGPGGTQNTAPGQTAGPVNIRNGVSVLAFAPEHFQISNRAGKSKRFEGIPVTTTAHRKNLKPALNRALVEPYGSEPRLTESPTALDAGHSSRYPYHPDDIQAGHPEPWGSSARPIISPVGSPTEAGALYENRRKNPSFEPRAPQHPHGRYPSHSHDMGVISPRSDYGGHYITTPPRPVLNVIPPEDSLRNLSYDQLPRAYSQGHIQTSPPVVSTEKEVHTPVTPQSIVPPPFTQTHPSIRPYMTPEDVERDCPDLDIFQVRRQLDAQKLGKFKKLMGVTRKDKYLSEFIMNRDIVLVVDNATTMVGWWELLKYTVLTISMKLAGLDDDGLDLKFTNGEIFNLDNVKGSSKISEQLRLAKPGTERRRTDMAEVLGKIFHQHLRGTQRKQMTLLIFTDGIWEGTVKAKVVEQRIAEFLAQTHNTFEDRRFSIEFISFGDDPTALKRLKDLDDDMTKVYKVKDVIDTEPWTGRVSKMILGSLRDAEDEDPPPQHGADLLASPIHLGEPQIYRSTSRRSTEMSTPSQSGKKRFSFRRDG